MTSLTTALKSFVYSKCPRTRVLTGNSIYQCISVSANIKIFGSCSLTNIILFVSYTILIPEDVKTINSVLINTEFVIIYLPGHDKLLNFQNFYFLQKMQHRQNVLLCEKQDKSSLSVHLRFEKYFFKILIYLCIFSPKVLGRCC